MPRPSRPAGRSCGRRHAPSGAACPEPSPTLMATCGKSRITRAGPSPTTGPSVSDICSCGRSVPATVPLATQQNRRPVVEVTQAARSTRTAVPSGTPRSASQSSYGPHGGWMPAYGDQPSAPAASLRAATIREDIRAASRRPNDPRREIDKARLFTTLRQQPARSPGKPRNMESTTWHRGS